MEWFTQSSKVYLTLPHFLGQGDIPRALGAQQSDVAKEGLWCGGTLLIHLSHFWVEAQVGKFIKKRDVFRPPCR